MFFSFIVSKQTNSGLIGLLFLTTKTGCPILSDSLFGINQLF